VLCINIFNITRVLVQLIEITFKLASATTEILKNKDTVLHFFKFFNFLLSGSVNTAQLLCFLISVFDDVLKQIDLPEA